MDERRTSIQHRVGQVADLVLLAKGLIDEAVKASPEASMAWAGVYIILPLLSNPKTANEANLNRFTYVTTRMQYHIALEPLLLRLPSESPSTTVSQNVVNELRKHIIDLYQHILEFQFRSVLRFYRSGFENFGTRCDTTRGLE